MGDYSAASNGRAVLSSLHSRAVFTPSSASPPNGNHRFDTFARNGSQVYSTSPVAERHVKERSSGLPYLSASASDPANFGFDARPVSTIMIRRLPRNISNEALASMLIFAGDLIDTDIIPSPYQAADNGYATAIARFRTQAGAMEAQQKLNGKPNTAKEANMIVEVHSGGSFERRNTIDAGAPRTQTSSASSTGSAGGPSGRSRFGSSFHNADQISPPLATSNSAGSGDFPIPETSPHFQNLFSPQSPLANGLGDHSRVSGKSMINDDAADEETGALLKDPVAYAQNGQHPFPRRSTNTQVPVSRFGDLSLSTSNGGSGSLGSPNSNGLVSPRNMGSMQSPVGAVSPTSYNGSGSNGAQVNFPRPQYPPVNPADQNPPCNTLYVGNLPIDTSEDELKALFSKQRGYKRLCFRTKQNGPMCFVEFEDVSFATKALNDLYGIPLHNSVKGGIRLSFSKNPLGVRSGQGNGLGPNAAMNPQAMAPGYGGIAGGNFSSVSGPPPGLGSPPGLMSGATYRSPPPSNGMDGMFSHPFGIPSPDFVSQLNSRTLSGGVPPQMGTGTFGRDEMSASYGRDGRNGYTSYLDHTMGR